MVTLKGPGKKKTGTLTCDKCGAISNKSYKTFSAAPELDACEAAEKDGWSFSIGFFAMLAGHNTYCPNCTKEMYRGNQ